MSKNFVVRFDNGLSLYEINGNPTLIDENGKTVARGWHDFSEPVKDLPMFEVTKKGFINLLNGVKPIEENGNDEDTKQSRMDKTYEYERIDCGRLIAKYESSDGKVGYLDINGNIVVPVEYNDAFYMGYNYIALKEGERWRIGEIYADGKFKLPNIIGVPVSFASLEKFYRGRAICDNGGWSNALNKDLTYAIGINDKYGVILTHFETSDALKAEYVGKFALVGAHNAYLTDFKYTSIEDFYEGIALASKEEFGEIYYGYISEEGEEISEFRFSSALPFEDGYGVGVIGGIIYYVNRQGVISKRKV